MHGGPWEGRGWVAERAACRSQAGHGAIATTMTTTTTGNENPHSEPLRQRRTQGQWKTARTQSFCLAQRDVMQSCSGDLGKSPMGHWFSNGRNEISSYCIATSFVRAMEIQMLVRPVRGRVAGGTRARRGWVAGGSRVDRGRVAGWAQVGRGGTAGRSRRGSRGGRGWVARRAQVGRGVSTTTKTV